MNFEFQKEEKKRKNFLFPNKIKKPTQKESTPVIALMIPTKDEKENVNQENNSNGTPTQIKTEIKQENGKKKIKLEQNDQVKVEKIEQETKIKVKEEIKEKTNQEIKIKVEDKDVKLRDVKIEKEEKVETEIAARFEEKFGKKTIWLFVRENLKTSKGDYYCCGRLRYINHDSTQMPIKFKFELFDCVLQRKLNSSNNNNNWIELDQILEKYTEK